MVTFIALLSSLSFHVSLDLFTPLLSFIAGLVTLTAFAFDIVLFVNVRDIARKASQGLPEPRVHDVVTVGPGTAALTFSFPSFSAANLRITGFWITLVSLVLLFMATCTVWLGRRRSRMEGTTDDLPPDPDSEKSGFFARFRRS